MSRSLILLSLSLLLLPAIGFSQVSSVKSGAWNNPLTWDCGCVPDIGSGVITIEALHSVTISNTFTVGEVVVNPDGILTINNGGRLIVVSNLTQEFGDPPLTNDGQVIIGSGGVLENRGVISSLPGSMIFQNGSEYQHNQTNGSVVEATWVAGSICRITGWTLGNTISTFRLSLNQSFQHFIWDSPGQIQGNVQLQGSLKTVNGNLVVNNTNGNNMVSLGGNNTTLNVGVDFIVNSSGRVSVASAGNTFTMNVTGNSILSSTTGTYNYQIGGAAPSGITNLNVSGDLILNSGQINLTSGLGAGNVNVTGDLLLTGGAIVKSGAGAGNISFVGSTIHNLNKVSGTFTAGNLVVKTGSTLNFTGNPLFMVGNIIAESGATLNMPATISTSGDLQFNSGSIINSNTGTLTLTGSTLTQVVNANGATLNNIIVDKSIAAANINLTSVLSLKGLLNVISTGDSTFINSNGNLTLLSTSDSTTGNASIGPLLNKAKINGNVTTQRFMSPEGRIYRYISSPVANPPVSQLQDDFPVTGPFTGSSPCTGCTTNASLFYYNATTAAYVNYPAAIADPLVPGRGYAAYVRQDVVPFPLVGITLDLTGLINQGPISMPVFHHATPDSSWNLVGNPYPSSIDWDDASWTKTNIGGSIAVRDNGVGNFKYWNGSTGGLTNGIIAAGQGFWVWTTAVSPVLTIQEAAKTSSTGAFLRKAGNDVVTIKLSKGNLSDDAYFQFLDDASLGFDRYDAPKLKNDEFDFSTRFANTSQLAINAVDNLPCGSELFLDLRFTKTASGAFVINPQGSYNVAFDIAGSEFDKYKISLLDQFTGTQMAVTAGFTYAFSITSNPASLASDRLKLRFEGIVPSLNLDLAGADLLCGSKVATVILKNSDSKFEYFLLKGGEVFSEEKSGNGGDLSFAVPGASLLPGSNQVEVGVKGVCGVEFLVNKWEVTRYQDVSISIEEGDILVSNYTAGNQWYLNDDLISGVNSQTLKVKKSGKYSVEVNTGECTSRADIDYAITGMESEQIALSIYPNPFKDKVYLASKELFNPATKVSIYNSLGQEVFNQSGLTRDGKETGYFNMGNLTDGVYFVRMNSPTSKDVYKILKLTH